MSLCKAEGLEKQKKKEGGEKIYQKGSKERLYASPPISFALLPSSFFKNPFSFSF